MDNQLTYREKRREESVKKFLKGEARKTYTLRIDIAQGLKERKNQNSNELNDNLRTCSCHEILSEFTETFNSMLHTGQKLINLASNYQPKTENKKYRNIKQQNLWLIDNVFDSQGNYIYCCNCIEEILGISKKRLNRLRDIKRQQAKFPIIKIRKGEVPLDH